jgi:hypothetical protein
MRVRALHVLVALASAALGSTLALSSPIEAKIPFEFRIGDKVFPPNEYIFETASSTEPHVLGIRTKATGEKSIFDTEQIPDKDDPKAMGLVFDRVGDATYLMEVWGVTDSGRGVKHTVGGKPLMRSSDAARERITAIRVVDGREKP